MKANKMKTTVNVTIFIALIGLFIVFPFKDASFIGGLFFAIFSAAVIGGAADTFAVSALFGHPLKIKWPTWLGTNIIARNRTRLMDELVNMVQNELLATEQISKQLKHYPISKILLGYIQSEHGKQTLEQILYAAGKEGISIMGSPSFIVFLKRLVNETLHMTSLSRQIGTVIKYIFNDNLDKQMITFLVDRVKPLLRQEKLHAFVKVFISQALVKYERDKKSRQFVNQVAGLNAETIAVKLIEYVEKWLDALQEEDHPTRRKLKAQALSFVKRVEEDSAFANKCDQKIKQYLEKWFKLVITHEGVQKWLKSIQTNIVEEQPSAKYEAFQAAVHSAVHALSKLEAILMRYEVQLHEWIIGIIEKNRTYIGQLVQTKLEEYSAEQLIVLVEDKAGKDLQYIRLNGAVVGSLIGAMLYVIQYSLGGA